MVPDVSLLTAVVIAVDSQLAPGHKEMKRACSP